AWALCTRQHAVAPRVAVDAHQHTQLTTSRLQHQLAEVAAGIQQIEHVRIGVDAALTHVLAKLEFALLVPLAKLGDRLRHAAGPIEHDQPLHAQSLREYGAQVPRALRQLGGVVGSDQSTHGDASERVHLHKHRVEDIAADVLEVDVDALRRGGPQVGGEIAGPVVNARVQAQLGNDVAALLGPAGDADRPASLDFGDLANDRADRTGGGGHHHGFPRFGLADLKEPEVGGPAGHAEAAQPALQGRLFRVDFDDALS